MTYPRVEIDTHKLRHNAIEVHNRCRDRGVMVTAVTKVTCADPVVVRTLLDAGHCSLGDSRLENLRTIRDLSQQAELVLLRLPMPSQADDVVTWADVSLNSELLTLRALDAAAVRRGVNHGVILMVDVGDLREGIWPDQLTGLCEQVRELRGLEVRGIGTNLVCYGGVVPLVNNMQTLLSCRDEAARVLGQDIPLVSGGNSANWTLMETGQLPTGVNHLRIGEALLLGNETIERRPIEGLYTDVFRIRAEVIEVGVKPSIPVGELGQDAFGQRPVFCDRGMHRRAIVAVGRQDVVPDGLRPEIPGVSILGASSDHMILDVQDASVSLKAGDIVGFVVRGYSCLLQAFTSPYLSRVRVSD